MMDFRRRAYAGVKRWFDILIALCGIILVTPIVLLVIVLIKLDSPGSVFYSQKRIGLHGKSFRIFKLRTMSQGSDEGASITTWHDNRITRVGRLLRRFEIDELPTLFNVLRGDMSLVGPRPELPQYVDHYEQVYRRVLTVRPGMTDFATLELRDEARHLDELKILETTYLEQILPRKLELNLKYIESVNLLTDIKIIIQTLMLIIRQKK